MGGGRAVAYAAPMGLPVNHPRTWILFFHRALIPTPSGVLLFCHAPKCCGVLGVGIRHVFLMATWGLVSGGVPGSPALGFLPNLIAQGRLICVLDVGPGGA